MQRHGHSILQIYSMFITKDLYMYLFYDTPKHLERNLAVDSKPHAYGLLK